MASIWYGLWNPPNGFRLVTTRINHNTIVYRYRSCYTTLLCCTSALYTFSYTRVDQSVDQSGCTSALYTFSYTRVGANQSTNQVVFGAAAPAIWRLYVMRLARRSMRQPSPRMLFCPPPTTLTCTLLLPKGTQLISASL